ncbi:MAG: U32 family peptidase [Ruminococcaceae bacterium]|nr:U32 family peptidase [Oscillospiraceae bacterium]
MSLSTNIKKPELLSPAGNFEKLKAALLYGADAVYCAGQSFGMRSAADNFTIDELKEAVEYTHARGKKLYLTLNTMPHYDEYPKLELFINEIKDFGIDAFIVADLGVMELVKKLAPHMEIHISTQASIVSPEAARAYASLGAKRLVLARELSFREIEAIRLGISPDTELEAFIHGSMCVSYSGRCMLSQMMTGRDGNRGKCTQPCRWNYVVYEEKRPDMPIPIEQTELGTFIMSSKDMCTIEHIPELIKSGIDSFKIEGRMKSAYYTAVVTNAYRMAIDKYFEDPENYEYNPDWFRELDSVSHREYCTGYYLDSPIENAQLTTQNGYIREKAYFATATEYNNDEAKKLSDAGIELENTDGKLFRFIQRNKVCVGDSAEIISPSRIGNAFCVKEIYLPNTAAVESAPHPSMIFWCRVPFDVSEGDIMRSGN